MCVLVLCPNLSKSDDQNIFQYFEYGNIEKYFPYSTIYCQQRAPFYNWFHNLK